MGNTESTTLFPGTSVTPGDSHPWRRPAFCRRSGHRNPSKFFLPTRISKARRATDSSLLRIQVTPEIGTSRICLKIDIVIIIVIVISKFLKRYLKAKRTTAPAYSRALRLIKGGFQRGVKKSSGPISRVPGGDRVAVRVVVVEMGMGNDQKSQGRSY